jgi:hypothetical protein
LFCLSHVAVLIFAWQVVVTAPAVTTNQMGQAVTVSTSAGRAVSLAQFVYAGGMLPIAQSRQPTKKTTCCVAVVTNGFAAPVLVSAVLTGAQVDISFDIPTNMGGMSGNFSCGRVLDTTTVALLGNGML